MYRLLSSYSTPMPLQSMGVRSEGGLGQRPGAGRQTKGRVPGTASASFRRAHPASSSAPPGAGSSCPGPVLHALQRNRREVAGALGRQPVHRARAVPDIQSRTGPAQGCTFGRMQVARSETAEGRRGCGSDRLRTGPPPDRPGPPGSPSVALRSSAPARAALPDRQRRRKGGRMRVSCVGEPVSVQRSCAPWRTLASTSAALLKRRPRRRTVR
jgi:hypothetical protein